MFEWLKRMFRREEPPVTEVLLRQFRKSGACPDCGGSLLQGPCGGLAMNLMCSVCAHEFNIGFGLDGQPFFLERIRWASS